MTINSVNGMGNKIKYQEFCMQPECATVGSGSTFRD